MHMYTTGSSATKEETLADTYYGTGTGSDYAPNPESNLAYPFHYQDSLVDTFQKVNSTAKMVTITYDGFGTLITPFATYTNVVRIHKNFGVGDYDDNWYITTPFLSPVVRYESSTNMYTLVGHTTTTRVANVNKDYSVQVYPNPVTSGSTIKVLSANGYSNASVTISDVTGRVMQKINISGDMTRLDKGTLPAGIYLYQVYNAGQRIANGKIIVQ